MDLRKSFDATWWDKTGNSAFGLKRGQSRLLALVFITVGVALADPPFGLIPLDFVNLFLAGWLSGLFVSLSFNMALVLTYTVIGWGLFFLGIWIYPYNTSRLLSSYVSKAKKFLRNVVNNPALLLAGLVVFYVMISLYKNYFGVV